MLEAVLNSPLVQTVAVTLSFGVTAYLLLSGIAKLVKSITLARRIEQNIINQIEDMVEAKQRLKQKSE